MQGTDMLHALRPRLLAVLLAPALQAAPVTLDVDLPSQGAGGGNLAVRVFAPGSASEARYPEGAPVVILGQGGGGVGTLNPALTQATDMVRIVFVFPGLNGSDTVGSIVDASNSYVWAYFASGSGSSDRVKVV